MGLINKVDMVCLSPVGLIWYVCRLIKEYIGIIGAAIECPKIVLKMPQITSKPILS